MVRPRVARGFRRSGVSGLASMYPVSDWSCFAPDHHGYQRACVLTNREHIIALEARGKGLVGMLVRYPYEIRNENEYFDEIQDVKVTKEMLDLAKHIVETKSADFDPAKVEDRYENALVELLNQKRKGEPVRTAVKQRDTENVINC